jgi:hypothetical protein
MRSASLVYGLDKNKVPRASEVQLDKRKDQDHSSGSTAFSGVLLAATKAASQDAFHSSLLTRTAVSTGLPRSSAAGTISSNVAEHCQHKKLLVGSWHDGKRE